MYRFTRPISTQSSSSVPIQSPQLDPEPHVDSGIESNITSEAAPNHGDPDTTHCVFPIQWDRIHVNGKSLQSCRWRQRHRRLVGTNIKPSWIYDHGADLELPPTNKRVWVCKACHLSKHYHLGVYQGNNTSHAADHLRTKHGLSGPKDPLPASSKLPLDHESVVSVTSTTSVDKYYTLATPFDDLKFKRDFIDLVVAEDFTFRQASSARLRDIILQGGKGAETMLQQSAGGISDWVLNSFTERRETIKTMLLDARSRINISTDLWSSPKKRSYAAIVAHFIGEHLKIR